MDNNTILFQKNWKKLTNLSLDRGAIDDEEMFILSDLNYVKKYCTKGGITEQFLKIFENEILPSLNIDMTGKIWKINSKIHRLRKHWIPALGNWHLDNIDRGSKGVYQNGVEVSKYHQPDYLNTPDDIYILFVVGESARTQLVDCDMLLEKPLPSENVYQSFHKQIEKKYKDNIITMDSGDVILFTSTDFHRASESLIDKSFFRYFIRLQLTSNTSNLKNKIRKQVQAYIDLGRDW
jgi:hypothetical protein